MPKLLQKIGLFKRKKTKLTTRMYGFGVVKPDGTKTVMTPLQARSLFSMQNKIQTR